ncbi:PIG-L family deacetylase [Nocardioides sp. SOB77]|uniref:PIG-L family deacetylase n=1 Tax=Nocardioides oceani TaxID=3058369 RepID=A0ABT8FA25_9ACTN|nr:PIG-L family deacetylase [Nocardioides oceani]MDN4171434.1 PIG-L family deacetylase [Nocardioides oceani]
MTMQTTTPTGAFTATPVDDAGRLLHAEDPAAQLALALARLEDDLDRAGRDPADLASLTVRTTDPAAAEGVLDVLAERLAATGAAPYVAVRAVPALDLRGMLVALDASVRPRLLVVVAHPDDEAFGCGSVLAHASAAGARTVVACATRGELGEPAPGSGLTRADLPTARERELRDACTLLGVERVEVLGYLDSGVDGPPAPGSLDAADPAGLRDRVAALYDEVRPDVVVTLDASDGHRDHAAVRDAVLAALDTAAHRPAATYLSCLARSLMAAFTGADPATTTLGTPDADITTYVDVADLLDLRWQAIRTHASQVPPFDAMDKELQHGFLAVDRLVRVDPPWAGGPAETTWIPRTTDHAPTHEGTSMTLTPLHTDPAAILRAHLGSSDCELHLPGDPGYDAARTPWNLAAQQRPAAVAVPRSVPQVRAAVTAAVAAGLRVAPQSTGHGAAALAETSLGDTVVVRLSELTGVTVDAATRTARVVGGTLWQDVAVAAAEHGLAALHGSAPDVAVAGYALGGGLSFYGRRHGLAASSITAVELVTADGSLLRASAEENPELFWAVRGGGGNLGVVVAIELALLELRDVHAGMLLWDREHAPEVVRAWASWTRTVPESVTTSLRVMSFPPLPELPPFLSGRDLVVIDGAVLEEDERAAELLAPLRALAPEMDTFGRIPAPALLGVHMDPPGPSPAVSDHAVLDALPDAAVEELLRVVGPGTRTGLTFAELRHLGGALARPAPGGGALASLPGAYALFCVAMAPTPAAAEAGYAAAGSVVAALAPWSSDRCVLNFAERRVADTSTAFEPGVADRVRAVRAAVDPAGVFRANHEL